MARRERYARMAAAMAIRADAISLSSSSLPEATAATSGFIRASAEKLCLRLRSTPRTVSGKSRAMRPASMCCSQLTRPTASGVYALNRRTASASEVSADGG